MVREIAVARNDSTLLGTVIFNLHEFQTIAWCAPTDGSHFVFVSAGDLRHEACSHHGASRCIDSWILTVVNDTCAHPQTFPVVDYFLDIGIHVIGALVSA